MSGRMRDHAALVTGGASGLGAACAIRLAQEGASVVIADIDGDAAGHVVEEVRGAGGTAHAVVCDVTSRAAVDAAVGQAVDAVGPLRCVVTSAGVASHPAHSFETKLVDIADEHWQYVLDVNLTGTLHTVQAGAKHMIGRGIEGSIVTVASFAAKRPSRGVYSVSKAAVWMLTRAFAEELGPYGVRVNTIAPGVIETPMIDVASDGNRDEWLKAQTARIALGRIGQPRDVADVALFLASAESAYLTGSILHPDGGLASSQAGG